MENDLGTQTDGQAAVRGLMINKENKNLYFCDQQKLISLNSRWIS